MKQKMIRHPYSTFSSFLKEHNNILKESLIALLICACGDLVAGIVLGRMDIFLETFPGLLVIIPGAIGMRGNIFGSFASRLSTALHIGIIDPKFNRSKELINNIFSSLINNFDKLLSFEAFIIIGNVISSSVKVNSLIPSTKT